MKDITAEITSSLIAVQLPEKKISGIFFLCFTTAKTDTRPARNNSISGMNTFNDSLLHKGNAAYVALRL